MGFPDQGQGNFPGDQGSSGQQPGGYGQQPGGFGQQPGGYGQPGDFGQQAGYQQPGGFVQPGGYGQPGYQQGMPTWPGGAGYPGTKTNGLAVAALICGLAQIIVGILSGIPAIILGHMARRQIRQTGEQGAGMAMAGLVLGYVGVALTVLLVVLLIIVAVANSPSVGN